MRRSWMKIRCQPLELTKNPRYRKSWYWLKTVRLRNAAYKTIFWKCNVSSRGRFLVVTFVSLPSRIVFLFQMRGELNMRKEEGKMEISGVLRNLIWSMWTHTHTHTHTPTHLLYPYKGWHKHTLFRIFNKLFAKEISLFSRKICFWAKNLNIRKYLRKYAHANSNPQSPTPLPRFI